MHVNNLSSPLIPFKRVLFVLLLLFTAHSIKADPFVEICYLDDCQYIQAEAEVNGCSGSDVVLYAIDPTSGDPCLGTATFQWYTYDFYNTGSGWEYGWITVVGATENRYEVNNHGTYQYYCKVTCNSSTYNTSEVEVGYNSSPPSVISHPEDVEICEGTEVFFEGLGTGSQIIYQWQTKKGTGLWEDMDGNDGSILQYIPGNDDNGRMFRLKISNNCAYTVTASANLTVNPNPQPDLGSDIHFCETSSVTLGVPATFQTYSWSNGASGNEITVSESMTVALTVTDDKGCAGFDDVVLTADPLIPDFNLGEDVRVCMGETVNLVAPAQFDSYTWNDDSNGDEITVSESGEYWVRVSTGNSVCENSDTIMVTIAEPFSQDHICMISTDEETGNNLVIWERTVDVGLLSYNVYRQSNVLGEYNLIGNVPADELSVFEDTEADPEVQQWVYKITAIDTCGNESDIAESPYHIPLFLQYVSSDKGVNLTWVPYEVQNGNMNFVSYVIFRGSDSLKLENIGTLSSDLTVFRDTDPDALQNRYFYRIAGVRANACIPAFDKKAGSGPFVHSLSNLEDNKLKNSTGIDAGKGLLQPRVYPNPFIDNFTIELPNPELYKRLQILDLNGKIVYTSYDLNEAIIRIERRNLKQGIYILEMQGKENYRQRIMVQ